jgi:hypothetical protein
MILFETLQQLKKIRPDATFSENSKRAILATTRAEAPAPVWSIPFAIRRIIEGGVAVALTGFFILLITGALSGSPLAPVQYSAIDPQSLHAEAQAIDIQIQLANLNYNPPAAESTLPTIGAVKTGGIKITTPATPTLGNTGIESSSTASSTVIGIDQTLKALSN